MVGVGARRYPCREYTSYHRLSCLGRVYLVWDGRLIVRDGKRKRRTWLMMVNCTR